MNKNKPNLLWIILCLYANSGLFAINNLRLGDARSAGTGGNEVVISPLFNPAMIAFSETKSLRIDYFNRYALKELGTVSGCFMLPNNRTLSAGIHITSFGYDAWRESMFRLLLAKKLNSWLTLGVSFQYAMLQTEIYDSEIPAQIAADIGLTCALSENILIGLLAMNCPSVSVKDRYSDSKREFVHTCFQAGISWKLNDEVRLLTSSESGDFRTFNFSIGIEYEPFDRFFFRAGMRNIPQLPSFGVGYTYSQFTIDAASVYHPVLGFSNGCGLSYSF